MITSLALIFLVGYATGAICQKIRLPRIIGMLISGIIIGPYVLNLLDPKILNISAELRKIALVIILIKAGLSLNIKDLKKVSRPAIMMAFIPATFELCAFLIFGPILLNITLIEAAIMGAVIAAVSPAVVVPRMVVLMENGYGNNKSIPQLILSGASLDDVYVIVLFSTFIGMAQGEAINALSFINIPISIFLGILLGVILGLIQGFIFEFAHKHNTPIRQSYKAIIILGFSFLLLAIEDLLNGIVSVSGLLGIISMALVIQLYCRKEVSTDLSSKFGKIWLGAEILLFVLVGAEVNISYTMKAGVMSLLMILISLSFRSIGVLICLIKTPLNKKERLYCIMAYLPKATVQAAIGAIPLSLGLACGNIVLAIAVLSILITAPLGAILMDCFYKKLLTNEKRLN